MDDLSETVLFSRPLYSTAAQPLSGEAANKAIVMAESIGSDFILLLDRQTELSAAQFAAALSAAAAAPADVAALALRVLPCGPGWYCNPVSLEADCTDADGVVLRCSAVRKVGGFDSHLTGQAAMADLCWRLRGQSFRLIYHPELTACRSGTPLPDISRDGYIRCLHDRCRLLAKYRRKAAAAELWLQTLRQPRHFDGIRKALLMNFLTSIWDIFCCHTADRSAKAFSDFSESYGPQRGQCAQLPLPRQPLVSIVVRTCNRPDTLRETLKCLYHQTYKSFEIVIVEDGKPTAQKMVREEFADLPICYHATGTNVGRGRAGNLGIQLARGEFVSFLDDDDYYYPEYIEQHLGQLLHQSDPGFVLSDTMALNADVVSKTPYLLRTDKISAIHFDHITLLDMCVKCRVPISGGMFARRLYDICGGMREDIDGDEDWAMWLRFWKVCNRTADRTELPCALSLCLYPADPGKAAERTAAYEVFDEQMLSDSELVYTCTAAQLRHYATVAQADFDHLKAMGLLNTLQTENHLCQSLPFDLTKDETEEDTVYRVTAQQLNRWYWLLAKEFQERAGRCC